MSVDIHHKITIPFVDFKRRYALYRDEILKAVDEVFSSGNYILGDFVEMLERELSLYLNAPYVLTVANGTDAIILALKVLNIEAGDEIILPANSFIASAGAVVAVGATPVLCDICDDLNIDIAQISKHITHKTKAVMPVHLTGRPANMNEIMKIAKENNLFVIEDAAQSIGATYHGKQTGTIGDFGCFSLHPLKNLHAYGDGGIMVAKNRQHYEQLKLLRNHGLQDRNTCAQWGLNSRLDALQAKIVLLGLTHLDQWNASRRKNAACYQTALQELVTTPVDSDSIFSVYHNFVILTEQRDLLVKFLLENGIDTRIHYPIPIHFQPAAKNLHYKIGDFPVTERCANKMLSLPVYPELNSEQIDDVIASIKNFFN